MKVLPSYPLNGADRFQLFFDTEARRNTGIGNVIRAVVTVDGNLSGQDFRQSIERNEVVRYLSSLELKSAWYSPVYSLAPSKRVSEISDKVTFHPIQEAEKAFQAALSRDCSLAEGSPLHIDVIPGAGQTQICVSANHVLFDHAGMETLLATLTGASTEIGLADRNSSRQKSLAQKLLDAVHATRLVISRSGWNMKYLGGNKTGSKPAIDAMELTVEETKRAGIRAQTEMKVNDLSFFLGSCIASVLKLSSRLSGKGNFSVAVPVDRRSGIQKQVMPGNFISFLFFSVDPAGNFDIKAISNAVASQMIAGAKKRFPEKFESLLQLFRFVPSSIYKAFINLPGKGRSGTFAFSLLAGSSLTGKSIMGHRIVDVTHYPPVIIPPGLNIVFSEFGGRLKIIVSFDESRISRGEVRELMKNIRNHLAG